MALRIKKKKQGYGSGPDLAGGPLDQSWAQVPPVTPPSGLGLRISVPKAPGPATSDGALKGDLGSIDEWEKNQQLWHTGQAKDLGRDYGFLYQEDPNNKNARFGFQKDATGNYVVDPANPFSKASLLQKSYQTARDGYRNSYAARGLGGSGAARAAQQFARGKYGEGVNSLVNSANANLGDLNSRYLGTGLEAVARRRDAQRAFAERREGPKPAPVGAPVGPSYAQVAQPQYANNPWVQRGLKGPNGEQLVVTNKGTYYRRKSDGKAIYIKRN